MLGVCHDAILLCGYRHLPHPSQEDGAYIPTADGGKSSMTCLPVGQGSRENQGETALMTWTVSISRTRKSWVTPTWMKRKSLVLPSRQTIAASRRRWTYKPRPRYALLRCVYVCHVRL